MNPARVKAAVVVAVTAVEGAGVRAEDEAVTGVEVVAEGATKRPCSPSSAPYAKAVAGHPYSYCLVLGASASEIAHPLCSNHSPHASAAQAVSLLHRKSDTAARPRLAPTFPGYRGRALC